VIMYTKIACIDARNLPGDVEDYCVDQEISTHYQNDVAIIKDDGNVFSEWLKSKGYKFESESGDYVAIIAT